MPSTGTPDWAERHLRLTNRLALVPAVGRLGPRSEEEPATLAHALLDIEELCREFHEELLPRLWDTRQTDQQIEEALNEMGELFRELIYHVRDPGYFRYLPGCESGNE